jgi:DNA-binding PadR family transcriptional regulator
MPEEEHKSMDIVQLPTTSYIILGMLSYREMSGYSLKQLMDRAVKHFYWSPAKSQIYAELRRLESHGYVVMREVISPQRPDKRIYGLTPQGLDALRTWLDNTAVGPDSYKSPLLLKVFLGHLASPGILISQIEARRQKLARDLVLCEEKEEGLIDRIQEPLAEEEFLFPLLALRFNMASIRAALTWADEALEHLSRWQQEKAVGESKT